MSFDETDISAAIIRGYHEKLLERLVSDALIVGAGPSGLVAAIELARRGRKVTVIEKRLTPGGGVWGGAMAMNEVIVQAEACTILDELNIHRVVVDTHLYRVDAIELASALTLAAVRSGAVLLNMLTVEDLSLHHDAVSGIVVNRTIASATLPIDPLTLRSTAVVDATGHDAALVRMLQRRKLVDGNVLAGEGPMNADEGERFVVERTGEVHRGLWVCGMAVCATWGGPRMGPIFGGMLLSGRRVAELIDRELESKSRGTQDLILKESS